MKYELKRWILRCHRDESKIKLKIRQLFYKVGTKLNVDWNLNKGGVK